MTRRQPRYAKNSQGWRAESGLRAPEWRCATCKTRSFVSRDTCRGCNKQRDEKHDEYFNEWSQTAAWPKQGGGSTARLVNKPKGPAQALALPRQQLVQAKASAIPEECIRILESKVQKEAAMKQAQPVGQKMGPSAGQISSDCRIWREGEALQVAQETFEQAQQKVTQAQTDLDKLMQEAPLTAMPVPQVNMSLVKTLEALTGIIENMWNPDAGPRRRATTRSSDAGDPGVEANPPELQLSRLRRVAQLWMPSCTPNRIPSSGTWTKTKPSRWRASKTPRSGRAAGGGDQGTQSQSRAHTDDPAITGPTFVSTSNAESQRHGILGTLAASMRAHPSLGKFLKFCTACFRVVAWICSGAHPENRCVDRALAFVRARIRCLVRLMRAVMARTPCSRAQSCKRTRCVPQTRWDSCNIGAALQILQTSAPAPQNLQTAAEVHSLVGVATDEHEIARINMQCAAIKLTATTFSLPPAKLVKRRGKGCGAGNRARFPAVGEMLTLRPLDALMEDQLCCEIGWARGHRQWSCTRQRSSGRRLRSHHLTADRRNQGQGNATTMAAQASPYCVGGGAHDAD